MLIIITEEVKKVDFILINDIFVLIGRCICQQDARGKAIRSLIQIRISKLKTLMRTKATLFSKIQVLPKFYL